MWRLSKKLSWAIRSFIAKMVTPEITRVLDLIGSIENVKKTLDSKVIAVQQDFDEISRSWDEIRSIREAEHESIGKITAAFYDDAPGFEHQLPYDAGIFDLPYFVDNHLYFNPSVVEVEGERRLIIRKMKIQPGLAPPYNAFSELHWVTLDDHRIVGEMRLINLPRGPSDQEQWEDPRIFNLGRTGDDAQHNKLWLTCTNFIQHKQGASFQRATWAHQVMAILDNHMRVLGTNHPVYGVNGPNIKSNTQHEKNWTWFLHDGKPHMIYFVRPHTVIECDAGCSPQKEYKSTENNRLWRADLGEPRGGSNPVRVGDEYWCFFHSSQPWWNGRRRYFMGAYAFEAKAPFRITRMSSEPILKGSHNNRRILEFPLVVFPGGALFDEEKQEWFVVMGINDCQCGWQKIPHEALLSMTMPVQQEPTYEVDGKMVTNLLSDAPEEPTPSDGPDGTAARTLPKLGGVESEPGSCGPDRETLQATGDADYPSDVGSGEPTTGDGRPDVVPGRGEGHRVNSDPRDRIPDVPKQNPKPRKRKARTVKRGDDVRRRKPTQTVEQ